MLFTLGCCRKMLGVLRRSGNDIKKDPDIDDSTLSRKSLEVLKFSSSPTVVYIRCCKSQWYANTSMFIWEILICIVVLLGLWSITNVIEKWNCITFDIIHLVICSSLVIEISHELPTFGPRFFRSSHLSPLWEWDSTIVWPIKKSFESFIKFHTIMFQAFKKNYYMCHAVVSCRFYFSTFTMFVSHKWIISQLYRCDILCFWTQWTMESSCSSTAISLPWDLLEITSIKCK